MITKKNRPLSAKKQLEKIIGSKLTLGNVMSSIRLGEEMTLQQFADLLGVSKQYLCDVEKGRRAVRPGKAAEYAQRLGYSDNQFVRLSLQDMLDRAGLKLKVKIEDS
jgi:transcriptional regulator with XRE-family HTH domain